MDDDTTNEVEDNQGDEPEAPAAPQEDGSRAWGGPADPRRSTEFRVSR